MSIDTVAPIADAEIETERLKLIQELRAESGDSWNAPYKPGTFGCHELLDRTALIAASLDEHVRTHPACVQNAEWFALATQAASALNELYQRIGAEHLGDD